MSAKIGMFWKDDVTADDAMPKALIAPPRVNQALSSPITFPPGKAGEVAQVIYQSAPRPVAEIAIVGAMGLLAGVCGRAWTIPKSGLNVYLILLARSGVGKEAMQDGISMFINAASAKRQGVAEFFDFNDYASGPVKDAHDVQPARAGRAKEH